MKISELEGKSNIIIILILILIIVALSLFVIISDSENRDIVSRLENVSIYMEEANTDLMVCEVALRAKNNTLNFYKKENAALNRECIWNCPPDKTYPFEEAAIEVANAREYDRYMYNCDDFTDDLVFKLRGLGYEAYNVWGHTEWGYHSWTKLIIYLESTTGEVLDPIYYHKNYGEARE